RRHLIDAMPGEIAVLNPGRSGDEIEDIARVERQVPYRVLGKYSPDGRRRCRKGRIDRHGDIDLIPDAADLQPKVQTNLLSNPQNDIVVRLRPETRQLGAYGVSPRLQIGKLVRPRFIRDRTRCDAGLSVFRG